MKRKKIDLSVIIVTFNSAPHIRACLDSVLGTKQMCGFEISVIDNHSSDGTPEIVATYPVHLTVNAANLGFARAVNIGMREARGAFFLLLNDDTEISDHVFDELLAFLQRTPRAAVVGPRVMLPDGRPEPFQLKFPGLAKEFVHANSGLLRLAGFALKGMAKTGRRSDMRTRTVDYVSGACFLIRRESVEQVGLLDERYFIYVEEVDWCWRLKKAGWHVYSYPHVSILHHFGQSTKQKPWGQTINWLLVERYRSILYFFKKNYGAARYFLLRLIVLQGFSFRFAGAWIAGVFSGKNKAATVTNYQAIITTAFKGI